MAGTSLGSKDKTPDKVPNFMEVQSKVEERLLPVGIFQECQSTHLEFSPCRCKQSSLLPLLQVLAQIPFSQRLFLSMYLKLQCCYVAQHPPFSRFIFSIEHLSPLTYQWFYLFICLLPMSVNWDVHFMQIWAFVCFIYRYNPNVWKSPRHCRDLIRFIELMSNVMFWRN